jgi:hypothetical protein
LLALLSWGAILLCRLRSHPFGWSACSDTWVGIGNPNRIPPWVSSDFGATRVSCTADDAVAQFEVVEVGVQRTAESEVCKGSIAPGGKGAIPCEQARVAPPRSLRLGVSARTISSGSSQGEWYRISFGSTRTSG